jgi:hypothetical protein
MQKNVAGRKTGALCRSIRVALCRGKNLSLGYVRETRITTNNEHVNECTAIASRRIIIRVNGAHRLPSTNESWSLDRKIGRSRKASAITECYVL